MDMFRLKSMFFHHPPAGSSISSISSSSGGNSDGNSDGPGRGMVHPCVVVVWQISYGNFWHDPSQELFACLLPGL